MTRQNYERYLFAMCGIAGMILGTGGGLVGVALPYINQTSGFSPTQLSTVGAALILGTIPGNFIGSWAVEKLGRVKAMRLGATFFLLGIPLICLSSGLFLLMAAGLFLQGVSCGTIAISGPMFLAECLPAEKRGRGAGMYQLILVCGLLAAMLLGVAVSGAFGAADAADVSAATKTVIWKSLFCFAAVPGAMLFLGTLLLKESPRWLYRRGRADEAMASLLAGMDETAAKVVYDEIVASAASDGKAKGVGEGVGVVKESVFQRRYMIPFVLVWICIVCVQLTGWSLMQTYPVMIFQKAGLSGIWANWASSAIMAIMVVMTVISCKLIDSRGRKFILTLGTGGLIVGLLAVGTTFLVIARAGVAPSAVTGLIVLAAFLLYVASFAIGPGVIAGLIAAEMLPTRIRSVGMLIATICNGFAAWGIAQLYLPWADRFGEASVFYTLTAFMVVFFLVTVLFVPETKGKTLEEIERHFAGEGR